MKTKSLFFIGIALLFLSSCVSVKEIGEINMISHRNIDASQHYVLLQTYVGSTDDERKQSTATSIQEAIDQTVKKIAGGEYLMNVRIYLVTKGSGNSAKRYFAAEGDVWGTKIDNAQSAAMPEVNGFKVGDKVSIKDGNHYFTATITALKDNTAMIQYDDNKQIDEVKYKNMTKIQ